MSESNGQPLNREQFLAKAKVMPSLVDANIPNYGLVRIRILSSMERTKKVRDWMAEDPEGRRGLYDACFVRACIVDPDTNEDMLTYDDIDMLSTTPGMLNQLLAAVMIANKLTEQDEVTFEKKLVDSS